MVTDLHIPMMVDKLRVSDWCIEWLTLDFEFFVVHVLAEAMEDNATRVPPLRPVLWRSNTFLGHAVGLKVKIYGYMVLSLTRSLCSHRFPSSIFLLTVEVDLSSKVSQAVSLLLGMGLQLFFDRRPL